jgi:hypothetical protein
MIVGHSVVFIWQHILLMLYRARKIEPTKLRIAKTAG